MKTKDLILEKSRKLFNSRGIRAVSLRDIAAALGISYGNLTYHYSSKENLLTWIYIQMMEEHQELVRDFNDENNLLENILTLPEKTFAISSKYLFLYQDYMEIIRSYPSIAEMQKQMDTVGNTDLYSMFLQLREQGILRADIDEQEIDYLIELGVSVRALYFMKKVGKPSRNFALKTDRIDYIAYINKLYKPYLTAKGLKIYDAFMKSRMA